MVGTAVQANVAHNDDLKHTILTQKYQKNEYYQQNAIIIINEKH